MGVRATGKRGTRGRGGKGSACEVCSVGGDRRGRQRVVGNSTYCLRVQCDYASTHRRGCWIRAIAVNGGSQSRGDGGRGIVCQALAIRKSCSYTVHSNRNIAVVGNCGGASLPVGPARMPDCSSALATANGDGSRTRCSRYDRSGFVNFHQPAERDRKSTRLNSSHVEISYAVF